MVIMVMAWSTVIFTQGVFNGIIGSRYQVDDATFNKGLQGAVYGDPVK